MINTTPRYWFLIKAYLAGTLYTLLTDTLEEGIKLCEEIKTTLQTSVVMNPITQHPYLSSKNGCMKCYEEREHEIHNDD